METTGIADRLIRKDDFRVLNESRYIQPPGVKELIMPHRNLPGPKAKPKKPDPLDGLPQIERFKAVARELECDEDPAAFETSLERIARHKPKEK